METEKTRTSVEHLWLAQIPAEHLWLALKAAGIGTWYWERETGRVMWCPTLERFYGLRPGSFEGSVEAFLRRVHPGDREAFRRLFDRAREAPADYENEYRILRPDGSVRWLHTHGRLIKSPSGETIAAAGVTRDVTERHAAEEAIRLSEERYRSLVVATSRSVWITTAAGELLLDSASWQAYTGQDREASYQLGWLDAVHPDDRERVWRTWMEARQEEAPREVECRVQRHDGVHRDFVIRVAPVLGPDGALRELIGAMTDITDKKRSAEEHERIHRELEHKRRILEAVLRQMPAGIVVAEPPLGRLCHVNEGGEIGRQSDGTSPGMLHWFGARALHADGTPYGPRDYPTVRSLLFGESLEGVEMHVERDGEPTQVLHVSSVPVHDEDGTIVAAVATATDVTDRVRLTRALAAERARLATVLDDIPAGVIIGDPPVGNVSYANKKAMEITGRACEPGKSVVPRCTLHRLRGLDGARIESYDYPLARALLRGESVRDAEFSFERGDGMTRYVRVNSAPVYDDAGKMIAAAIAFSDITQEIEARRARERTEHFRELFVGMLGHDLRNPLSAIITGALLALGRGSLVADDARAVERMRAAAQRMTRMIDQVLDLTRSRLGGGIPVVRGHMDLRELLGQIVDEFEAAHPTRAIRVEMQGDLQGSWDRDRLGQLTSNLLGNALEHGDPDRPIEVRAGREGEAVKLSVHNQGAPIPPEDLPEIFNPFHRSASKKERAYRGLGLGLYICQQIAEAHGGTLDVESRAETGTTFTVELPVAEKPSREGA